MSAPATPIPTLLRPPSFHPATVEWAPGHQPRFVVINPMHIITLQENAKTFGVRVVEKIKAISEKWFTHVLLLLFLIIYAVIGAFLFQWLEETKENLEKGSVDQTRKLVIQQLWDALKNYTTEEEKWQDWQEFAKWKLKEYEEQVRIFVNSGTVPDVDTRLWSFWGALFYCGTVFTTIGYGNIFPATTAGQAVTIVYAFIGIPFLLMVLADLGKLFTRWIKALFYYVKLFYRTGKFRKARKMGRRATAIPVQYMSVAWNKMPYMMSPGRRRRPSSADVNDSKSPDIESGDNSNKATDCEKPKWEASEENSEVLSQNHIDNDIAAAKDEKKKKKKVTTQPEGEEEEQTIAETTTIAAVGQEEVNDEFNLPVSLAVLVLVIYMMVGAGVFTIWEDWTFFQSFYFVFISMSTIGFGDYVPQHPIYMMGTFIYLLFGLALTSMCINIVQEKLSATFEMAKLRIGTTIGLDASMFMAEEVSPERSDTPDSQKTKSSLKSRRGSKVPPGKSSEKSSSQSDEDEKKRLSGESVESDSEKPPQQVENGTIKKRPNTLDVPTTLN